MHCKDCNHKQLAGYIDSDKKKLWCPVYRMYVDPLKRCPLDSILDGFWEGLGEAIKYVQERQKDQKA